MGDKMKDILNNKNQIVDIGTKLIFDYKHLLGNEEYKELKNFIFELAMKDDFESYNDLKRYELPLLSFIARVWKTEMTNIERYKKGDKYKLIICEPLNIENQHFDYLVKGTLFTEQYVPSNYGLVCNVDSTNFIMAFNGDKNIQLVNSNSLVIYCYNFLYNLGSKFLMSPGYVVGINFPSEIEKNTNVADELPNCVYLNKEKTKFSKVVLFEPYTEEDLIDAAKLAEKYNLDIIRIPRPQISKTKVLKKLK